MSSFFFILMLLAMLAVLGSLVIGLYFMTQEGPDKRQKSNKWMRARVMLQGLALILFALAVLAAGN